MTALRRVCVIAVVLLGALTGCWQGPEPPRSTGSDTYGFRAPLVEEGTDALYRFDVTPDIDRWMTQRGVQGLAVFDADGQPARCGEIGSRASALDSMSRTTQGEVRAFDPEDCEGTDEVRICAEGHPCVPDYCPHVTAKQRDISLLEGADTPDALLALANADLPPAPQCVREGQGIDCTAGGKGALDVSHKRDPRRDQARALLRETGFADEYDPELDRAKANRGPPIVVLRIPPGAPGAPIFPYRLKAHPIDPPGIEGGFVVAFDEAPSELRLIWNRKDAKGTVRLVGYDAAGKRFENRDALQGAHSGSVDELGQRVRSHPTIREYRVVVESDAADLQLIGATSTTHVDKPFVRHDVKQYWFSASGHGPYWVYLEPHQSTCARTTGASFENVAAAADPDWPRAAMLGSVVENPRGHMAALEADHRGIGAWLNWGAAVGVAWLLALLAVVVRWLWIAYGSARRRC